MKNCYARLFAILLWGTSCLAQETIYPAGRVTVRVLDENGSAVSNATVGVVFYQNKPKGSGVGVNSFPVEGLTSTNGAFSCEREGTRHVRYGAWKDGYYPTLNLRYVFTNYAEGKWQPWDANLEVVLQEKKSPVPMYAKRIDVAIPGVGIPVGYDLIAGDWVAPHGEGAVSDIAVEVKGYYKGPRDNDAILKVIFPNPGDGMVQKKSSGPKDGALRIPPTAPNDGYRAKWTWRKSRNRTEQTRRHSRDVVVDDYDKEANYFLRIRTRMDDNGEVREAMYGKIYGDFKFTGASEKGSRLIVSAYYVNPDGTRNVEFDPKRNLFHDLERRETVDAP